MTKAAEFISVLNEKYQSHTKLKTSKITMQLNDKMDVMIKLFSVKEKEKLKKNRAQQEE